MPTVPGGVYAQNAPFAAGRLVDEMVREHCRRLEEAIVRLSRATSGWNDGVPYPTIQRKAG